MRTLRVLFLIIILLAVAGVIFAHWFVGNPAGISFIENKIASETGLRASVGSARLTPVFSLVISDLRVWFTTEEAKEITVLTAPEVTLARHRGGYFTQFARPVFTGVKAKFGDWTPAQMRILQDGRPLEDSIIGLSRTLKSSFEIKDASVVLRDDNGKVLATYSGLNWAHRPAFVDGHPGLMQDVVTLQCLDGEQSDFSHEWLSDDKEVYPLVGSRVTEKKPNAPETVVKVEAVVEKPLVKPIEKSTKVIEVAEPPSENQVAEEPIESKQD